MATDVRVNQLQRQVAAGERLLRDLQRRRQTDPGLQGSYYRVRVALQRRKAELRRIDRQRARPAH